jgi:hypothetical protein
MEDLREESSHWICLWTLWCLSGNADIQAQNSENEIFSAGSGNHDYPCDPDNYALNQGMVSVSYSESSSSLLQPGNIISLEYLKPMVIIGD